MTAKLLDQSSFNDWLDHPVTEELMNLCVHNIAVINDGLTNGSLIMAPNSTKLLARNLGMKEILERIRDLRLSDLIVTESNEDDPEAYD